MLSTIEPATSTHETPRPRTLRRGRRLLGTAVLTVAGLGLTGTGAYASWQAMTIPSSEQISIAGVAHEAAAVLDAGGGSLTTGVADLAPGDYFYRYVDVRNDDPAPGTFAGTVEADGPLAGHLAVEATSCTLPWDTTGGASTCPDPTPLGSGVPTAGGPVTVTHGQIATGTAGAQHVRYRVTFSPTAPAHLHGHTGTISITVGPATSV